MKLCFAVKELPRNVAKLITVLFYSLNVNILTDGTNVLQFSYNILVWCMDAINIIDRQTIFAKLLWITIYFYKQRFRTIDRSIKYSIFCLILIADLIRKVLLLSVIKSFSELSAIRMAYFLLHSMSKNRLVLTVCM